jgi:SOS-response transcriptional repressor LexA
MRDELGRRPSPSELFYRGYLPRTLAARFDSWFGFISEQGNDLTGNERLAFESFASWLAMLEVSSLNKSYKMVVIRVLLDRDAFWSGMDIEKLAVASREFLLSHPTLRHDLPPTQQFPDPSNAPIKEWAAWWLKWPLSRWMDEQAGRQWFKHEGDRFVPAFQCPENLKAEFESMTAELVDYRLAQYAKNRIEKATALAQGKFLAKVSHSTGKPILRLPTAEELPGRPVGPTTVNLPDGSQWVFRFVKIACNVASPVGSKDNQILELLRGWFGENAGSPGTNYQVAFNKSETGWSVEPVAVAAPLRIVEAIDESEDHDIRKLPGFVDEPANEEKLISLVPVYSLEAAAGLWGPESSPEEIGWAEPAGISIKPGMFIARVCGHSMEPKIRDGSWNLFRRCPQGSREGRIVLVQFNSMGDPENGGRFTVKKYHSQKTITEDSWHHEQIELLPLNPDFSPIPVAPHEGSEMVVVGEWVTSID